MNDNDKRINDLRELLEIQGRKGTIDQGDYMVGLYNGMLLGLCTITGEEYTPKNCDESRLRAPTPEPSGDARPGPHGYTMVRTQLWDQMRERLALLSRPTPTEAGLREADIAESCYEAAHAMPQYDAIQFISKLISDPDPAPSYPLTEAWLERDKAKADFAQLQLCLDAECELRRDWQIRAEKAEAALAQPAAP